MRFPAQSALRSFAVLAAATTLPTLACSSDDTPGDPPSGGAGAASVAGASTAGGAGSGTTAGSGGNGGGGGTSSVGMAGSTSTGGAATGGGSSGAGSSTAGGTMGGSTFQCIVCDDFESATTGPDQAKWTIDASRKVGTATVDAGAYGSAKSLKVSGGYLKIDTKAGSFTGVASKFWVRINMKFDIAQPTDHVTYLMLTDAAKGGELRVGAQNLGMIWNHSTNDTILPDYNEAANSLKPAANEWHCFEFEIDSTTPALHVYMDGQESPKMLLDATPTTGIDDRWQRDLPGWKPQITSFAFGAGDPTAGKVTTWYDDVAISNDRPGCTF